LGIRIRSKLALIVKFNHESLTEEITESINRWTSLPLSLIGRINIIKMNILPEILYLFQNIPLSPLDGFLKEINKVFTVFIWQNNKARI